MSELLVFFAVSIFVTALLAMSMKIAGESERFAVFMLGRFQAFKGPGLIVVAPYTQQAHRLRVGDIGVLTGSECARFGAVDIPIGDSGSLRQGQAVRIDSFDGVEPKLVASSVPVTTMCPNCGHKF